MGSSGDGEFTIVGIRDMRSAGDEESTIWCVQDMDNSGDGGVPERGS